MYIIMCAFVWLPEKSTFFRNSNLQMLSCACAANDAGREATGGSPQELAVKQLV